VTVDGAQALADIKKLLALKRAEGGPAGRSETWNRPRGTYLREAQLLHAQPEATMRAWLRGSICLVAVGCISTNVQRLDHATRPARSPDAVGVLFAQPQQPYTVIAVIDAKAKTVFDSFDDLRNEMVAKAATLGGDAVILGRRSTETEFILVGTTMIQSDMRKLAGQVIVYERGKP
jgi:hypothetical protein